MRYLALALAALTLVSCTRDPNVLKQKYLESGNKYFDAGRLKEASIMYRRSLEQDKKFGEAYYRLALADLRLQEIPAAVGALRRALDSLKPGTPSHNDATLKLAEIMVVAAQAQEHAESVVKDVQTMTDGLLARNPNGWEGHKLSGDLAMLRTASNFRAGQGLDAKKSLADSIAEYRKALSLHPNDYVVTLALGRALVLDGEVGEAESLFKNLVARDKVNVNGYYELYRVYISQRRFDEAEAILKAAVATHRTDPAFRMALAQFYFATNKKPQLIALLNDMKSDLKSFPQAYLQAGDFYLRVNPPQPDEAMKQYEEGIQKDPDKKTTYLNYEVAAYIRQNKMDQAMAKNDEILRIDPKNPEARQLKATAMLDKGDVNQAMTDLQSVVTAKPNNFVARFNLGRAHFARQEYEQARQEFDKAVELRPDYLPARFAQTQVAFLRGDNEGALHYADAILKQSPNSVQGRVMKAAALQRLQKFDEARNLLTEVLDKNPKQVETLLELGVLDMNEKKYKEAIPLFQRAWDSQPTNIRGLLGESMAYLRDGQTDKSVQVIQVEAQKQPQRLDLQSELGNAEMSAGRYDDAIRTYQDVLSKTKETRARGDVLMRVALCYRNKGDAQHSIESLEKARGALPNNGPLTTNLAMAYDEAGKKELARKDYELAIRIEPNNAYALNNLAYLITEAGGDLNLAQTYAERAKRALPNYTEITDTLGWIMMKKNLTDGALDNFRSLVVKVPQNPIYHYHYAMALTQKGDRETAKKECMAALANHPNKSQEDEIKKLMARIS